MFAAAAHTPALWRRCEWLHAGSRPRTPTEAAMLELERYELKEGPAYRFELERREFLKTLGGGMLFLLLVDGLAPAQESGGGMRGDARPENIGAWLHISADGKVKVFTGKTEVGQNIRTSLTQAVAEELHVPVNSIELVMADTDLTP